MSIPWDEELINKIEKRHRWDKNHEITQIERYNLWHLSRRRRWLKREIKLRMFSLWLEYIFSQTDGWRDKILNTKSVEEK